MTNADNVRHMTDEELVNVLCCVEDISGKSEKCGEWENCDECKKHWLNETVEMTKLPTQLDMDNFNIQFDNLSVIDSFKAISKNVICLANKQNKILEYLRASNKKENK